MLSHCLIRLRECKKSWKPKSPKSVLIGAAPAVPETPHLLDIILCEQCWLRLVWADQSEQTEYLGGTAAAVWENWCDGCCLPSSSNNDALGFPNHQKLTINHTTFKVCKPILKYCISSLKCVWYSVVSRLVVVTLKSCIWDVIHL